MLETALILQNPHWSGRPYANLFNREQLTVLLKKLCLKEIQIALGIRRSGKSTLFKLVINHLLTEVEPKSILYVNLDDPFFVDVWKSAKLFYKIIETAEKLTSTKVNYLFLDEIQNVEEWERFVKSVYDSEVFKKIFITGSNSSLLKSSYAKLLSGRYVVEHIEPLSFREVLENENIKTNLELIERKPKALKLAEQLLFYGGFPEIFKTKNNELKRELLLNYYDTIVLKDCIANHNIRETKKLQELALYLLTNNSSLYSYNSLSKAIDSNENTLKEFVHIFEDSFLIDEIKNFSYTLKQQSKSKKKSYCVDNGLIHAVSNKFSDNKGKLFENFIYNELKKFGFKNIYFFNDHKECDFIIKNDKTLIGIQAAFELNTNNRDREIIGLKFAMEKFGLHKGYIVTFNSDEEELDNNIIVIPFWKLFFGDSL